VKLYDVGSSKEKWSISGAGREIMKLDEKAGLSFAFIRGGNVEVRDLNGKVLSVKSADVDNLQRLVLSGTDVYLFYDDRLVFYRIGREASEVVRRGYFWHAASDDKHLVLVRKGKFMFWEYTAFELVSIDDGRTVWKNKISETGRLSMCKVVMLNGNVYFACTVGVYVFSEDGDVSHVNVRIGNTWAWKGAELYVFSDERDGKDRWDVRIDVYDANKGEVKTHRVRYGSESFASVLTYEDKFVVVTGRAMGVIEVGNDACRLLCSIEQGGLFEEYPFAPMRRNSRCFLEPREDGGKGEIRCVEINIGVVE
jgi:hypothetical protein